MPSILRPRQDSNSQDIVEPGTRTALPIKTCIIIAVVIVVLLIAGLAVLMVIRSKRRQDRNALEMNPSVSVKDFMRRRKLSALDLQAEEERQRSGLIRKSLASRSSKSSSMNSRITLDSFDMEEDGLGGLKEDWKEWEARLMSERRKSHPRHPSLTSIPSLPVPAQARSRSSSQSRASLMYHHTSPPLSRLSSS